MKMYDYFYNLKRGKDKGYDNGLNHRIHSLISVLASLGFLLSLRLFVSPWRLFVSICLSLFSSSYSCRPSYFLFTRFRLPQSSADRLRVDPNRGPAVPKPRVLVRRASAGKMKVQEDVAEEANVMVIGLTATSRESKDHR